MIKDKFKDIPIKNILYSVFAMLIFNGVIQFLVYPQINSKVGEETFGGILTLLSVIAVLAGSFGTGVANCRLVNPKNRETKNGDYNYILFILCGIAIIVGFICLLIYDLFSIVELIFFSVLLVLTLFRYYSDVEFKETLNFKRQFIFYSFISLGYIFGLVLFQFIDLWEIAFLLGEGICLFYVFLIGRIYKPFLETSENSKFIVKYSISLIIGELIANFILNIDRLLLYFILDGTTVTTYYAASLLGKIVALITVPLNGVLLSYLSKYKGFFPKKKFLLSCVAILVVGFFAFIVCYLLSPIFIKYLYSEIYDETLKIIFGAILAQILFFCSNIMIAFVIKFLKSRFQLIINIIYGTLFAVIAIILTLNYGLNGFVVASVIGNIIRIILILLIYLCSKGKNNNVLEENKIDC